MKRRDKPNPVEQQQRAKYLVLLATLRPDQIAFANHLLSSWGDHREFFSDKPITVGQNIHIPVVRHVIRIALERRP